ncbi:MAG: hypothetical protein RIF41_09710 [Polyangiaceae bacterium]
MPSTPELKELKRALREGGLEVYRTEGTVVHLADRVRENLIMDAHVRVAAHPLTVTFDARAERSVFPGESDQQLHERARALGRSALERGFGERRAFVTDVPDPNNADAVLERWYQVEFERSVDDVATAIEEARFAVALDKTATR